MSDRLLGPVRARHAPYCMRRSRGERLCPARVGARVCWTAAAPARSSSPIAVPASNCRRPTSTRAQPFYRRAADFEAATTDLPAGPYTLHQLRHSALTHAAEDGASTSTLLAYSGHTSVASLARYARVSPEGLARWQQGRDPAARRRS
ncbi:tyrosine-type recombinase/integrase [Nonomuraea sp. H19]|uniref:tyrosine-type recombinase/integrase n=1 Tax=Nonomuraea sp. H19 TaxID=3452206 RepID=UPI003F8BE865